MGKDGNECACRVRIRNTPVLPLNLYKQHYNTETEILTHEEGKELFM